MTTSQTSDLFPHDAAKLRSMHYVEFEPLGPSISKEDLNGSVRLYIGRLATSRLRHKHIAVILDVDTTESDALFMTDFPAQTVERFGDGNLEAGRQRLLELFSSVSTTDSDASEFCAADIEVRNYSGPKPDIPH